MLNTRNNFIFAPVKLGYCNLKDGKVTGKHVNFYNVRSKHVGLVTYEPLYLSAELRETPAQLGIDTDDKIAGLTKLNKVVHNNGAKAIAHLNHPGRLANPKIPGNQLISSTDKMCPSKGVAPKRMDHKTIQESIRLFADAAKRAEQANFDAIEIQFGHGYLIAQFLSPAVNDRTDEYGGSFDNRIRFGLEVLEAVQNETSLPVFVRMTGSEIIPNGIDIQESVKLASILKTKNVDAVHVVAGSGCETPPWFFQHMFIPKGKTWELASKIKKETGIPIVAVGRIHSKEDVSYILNTIGSNYVAIGRALVADPDFVGKYLGTIQEDIRPCLACSEGCLGGVASGKGLGCIVNPLVGQDVLQVKLAETKKNIAVIGGGLAGMEAAVRLKERGHNVKIYEKNKLGGQFNLAWLSPQKDSLKELIDFYKKQLDKKEITVEFTEATPDNLEHYDEIVIATGALPVKPKIKGLTDFSWAEIMEKKNIPKNKKILIIGGGLIGIEIANALVNNNNEVIIVELLEEIGRGMEMIEKKMSLQKLEQNNVKIYTKHEVTEIKNGGKTVVLKGEKVFEINNIDTIVVSVGMKSENTLKHKLANKVPCHIIGDAVKPAKAQNAIYDGFSIANAI